MKLPVTLLLACCLTGCASQIVDHSFGFDMRRDNQDAVVLDYRYGESKLPVRAPEGAVQRGEEFYATGVTGPMLRGNSLYVKWKIKSTERVYEDTVDLRNRLPKDMVDHRVYFMVDGPQLYVYLISPNRRPPEIPPNGPEVYHHRIVTTIYPDQAKR